MSYSCDTTPEPASTIVEKSAFTAAVNTAVQTCTDKYSKPAKDCCGNGDNCGMGSMPGAGAGGMESICKDLATNSKLVKEFNQKVSGTCLGRKERCAFKCNSVYESLKAAPIVGMTAAEKETALEPLLNLARECDGLSAKKSIDQALSLADTEKSAKECSNLAKADPPPGSDPSTPSDPSNPDSPGGPNDTAPGGNQAGGLGDSMGPMLQSALPMLLSALNPQAAPTTQPQEMQQLTCEQNPGLAGCPLPGQGTNESWNDAQGTADAKQEPQGSGDFNLQNTGDIPMPQSLGDVKAASASNPPTVNAVPNGGGGIPGGGGGGPASLGGGGGGGGAQLNSKADVLHGVGGGASGNFGQTNEKMNMKSGDSGGYSYNNGSLHEDTMNLADFLPGGKNDPTKRNVAGIGAGTATTNFQIQSKDVNIWNRISDRIKSRCSQGLLRDCIP